MGGAIIIGLFVFVPMLIVAFIIMRVDLLLHFLTRDEDDEG